MNEASKALADKLNNLASTFLYENADTALIREAAAALRSQPGKPDREEVAGIILYGIVDDWENGATTTETYQTAKRLSLQLADRILALTPSHEAPAQEPDDLTSRIDKFRQELREERYGLAQEPVADWHRAAQICRDKYCELIPGKRTWAELTDREREVDVICLKAALYAAPASHDATREATIEECSQIVHDYLVKMGLPQTAADLIEKIRGALSPTRADRAVAAEDSEEDESPEWLLACRLAGAELNYRNAYQTRGPSHSETGRCWDKMRKAGDAIRAHEPNGSITPPESTKP